jgi:hypothetical protein
MVISLTTAVAGLEEGGEKKGKGKGGWLSRSTDMMDAEAEAEVDAETEVILSVHCYIDTSTHWDPDV